MGQGDLSGSTALATSQRKKARLLPPISSQHAGNSASVRPASQARTAPREEKRNILARMLLAIRITI